MRPSYSTWVDIETAARALSITVNHARVLAHRYQWRRQASGRRTLYWLADAHHTSSKRDALDAEECP